MGALPRPHPKGTEAPAEGRKPPQQAGTASEQRELSPAERLRAQTDYDQDSGYAPLYHAVIADLPRLSSGAVCYAFVLVVNMLSYGRGVDAKTKKRYVSTLPVSAAELAELCRANVRDIQRQLDELAKRNMIAVKPIGPIAQRKYVISLLYRDWPALEDYAVWKRKQPIAIDSKAPEDQTESEDETLAPISKEAVELYRKPCAVRPGRAARAVRVSVGVREFVFQNESAVDASVRAVIDSGRLVVSASVRIPEQKSEDKANAIRHGCRDLPTNEGSKNSGEYLKSAEKISQLFDPLLQKAGSRLLSPDTQALDASVRESGAMPHDFLIHFVMTQRASRPISGPKVVPNIVRDARLHWERAEKQVAANVQRCHKCGCDLSEKSSIQGACYECYNKHHG